MSHTLHQRPNFIHTINTPQTQVCAWRQARTSFLARGYFT